MFISKKHISRRTVLKGIGATIALPLLDAMIPAATAWADTAAGKTPKRFAFVGFPHGAIMDQLVAEGNRHGLHHVADPAAAGAVPQASDHRLRLAQQARGNARAPRLHRARLADLREALGLRQGRSGLRRQRRPDRRSATSDRTRVCRRSNSRPRRAAPASPGARRPSRCRRKATRARSSRSSSDRATPIRNAPRSSPKPAASWIACKGQAAAPAGQPRRAGPRRRQRLSRLRSRDRAPRADGSRRTQHRAGHSGCAGRHAERYHRVFQADVRPDGPRVPGRHHARDHALDGSRSQHAHVHEPEHRRRRSIRCRITATIRRRWTSWCRFRSTTREVFAGFIKKIEATKEARRHRARSFHDSVRQRHEQQRSPQQRSAAVGDPRTRATERSRAAST